MYRELKEIGSVLYKSPDLKRSLKPLPWHRGDNTVFYHVDLF